ncbi:MAG: hypothetical protein JSW47_06525, partial [Phycisphaerales bacterium]
MPFWKKISPRRSQVRKNISAERFSQINRLANTNFLISILIWMLFVVLCTLILSLPKAGYREVLPTATAVLLVSVAAALYVYHYQRRITKNHARALVLVGLFLLMLVTTKLGVSITDHAFLATGSAVTTAVVLTIAYDQRFAMGMSMFYCVLA